MLITNFGTIASQGGGLWLNGWRYGKKITIPASKIEAELNNFPVTVYLNNSNFDFSQAYPDGRDIRFTDAELNPLKFERREHDGAYLQLASNTSGGDMIYYEKANILNTSKTTVFEAEVKVASSGSSNSADLVIVCGQRYAVFRFLGDRVICSPNGNPYSITRDTTSKYYKYTIKVNGTTNAEFFINDVLVHTMAYTSLPSTSGNSIYFGDGSTGAGTGGISLYRRVRYNLDYVGDPVNFIEMDMSKLPTAQGWTVGGTAGYGTIFPAGAVYNISVPEVSNTKDTEIYMWYGHESLFEIPITKQTYLYNLGDECVDLTDGWIYSQPSSGGTGRLTKNADHMIFTSTNASGTNSFVLANTNNPIDVRDYSRLRIQGMILSKGTHPEISLRYSIGTRKDDFSGGGYNSNVAIGVIMAANNTPIDLNLDISNVKGDFYITFATLYNASIRIDKVWIEGEFRQRPLVYNTSIESWQDQTGKQLTYNGNVKIAPTYTNLAKGKIPIYNGTLGGSNNLTRLTDGDLTSGNYVEQFRTPQAPVYFEIDLGDIYPIDKIQIWHYYADSRTYYSNKTEISEDGNTWIPVFDSEVNGRYSENSSGRSTTFPTKKARYVRDWLNGSSVNTGNHWVELQVWGYADGEVRRAALFDGSGDYFTLGGQSDLAFGASDFCIEMIYKPNVLGTEHCILDTRPISTNGAYIFIGKGTDNKVLVYIQTATRITSTTVLSLDNIYHIALVRTAGITKLYVNGVKEGADYADSNSYIVGTNRPIIGANGYLVSNSNLNGNIYGIRITKGRARYTTSFIPPASFEIDNNDVVFCTNFDTIYDGNYIMVQHLAESAVDASGYGNNVSIVGTTISGSEYGKVRTFNNQAHYVQVPNIPKNGLTLQVMMKTASTQWLPFSGQTTNHYIMANTPTANFYHNNAGSPICYVDGNPAVKGLYDNAWHLLTAKNCDISAWNPLKLNGYNTWSIVGQYRDFRISDISRSDAWVKTETLTLKNELIEIQDI